MKWLIKAVFQKIVGQLPRGERINYLFQRRVFRNLPATEASFRRKVTVAVRHFEAWLRYAASNARAPALWYEFGAGRDLIVPLAYAALGVRRQVLLDLTPMLHFELVNDAIARLDRARNRFTAEYGHPFHVLGPARVAAPRDLGDRFGIDYRAPADARSSGLRQHSIAFISSTDTLEHVSPGDLERILAECRRILQPRGLASFWIDLTDHYAAFDDRLPLFNFLRFSDSSWRLINSPLHYQNRLRAPDYLRLLAAAGFEIVASRFNPAGPGERARTRSIKIDPRFRSVPPDQLGVRELWVIGRAPG